MHNIGTLYEAQTGNCQGLIVENESGRNVAVTYEKQDAEPIVRACNAHDELVSVLRDYIRMEDEGPGKSGISPLALYRRAQAAIRKATVTQ